jgi:hypothetical protein
MRLIITWFVGLASVGGTSVAHAQSRRLIFEDIAVEGRVQKPVIDIFMRRQNLNTGYKLDLRESFLPKIVESIEKKPF